MLASSMLRATVCHLTNRKKSNDALYITTESLNMSIAAPLRTLPRRTVGAAMCNSNALRLTAAGATAPQCFHTSLPRPKPKPTNPEPRANPSYKAKPPSGINVGRKQFADFDLKGRVFVVTGAARGLGLALAEALVEAGGKGE
jgi:hypothetical protein